MDVRSPHPPTPMTPARPQWPQPDPSQYPWRLRRNPVLLTDNDGDSNHDPDYDPPGISEAELHFHQAQFEREHLQRLHTGATVEPMVTPTETNSESSGGDSVADAAQRQYWQQQEEHHSTLRQQMRRAAMENVDPEDAARSEQCNLNPSCCCFTCGKPGHWAYQCTNAGGGNKASTALE